MHPTESQIPSKFAFELSACVYFYFAIIFHGSVSSDSDHMISHHHRRVHNSASECLLSRKDGRPLERRKSHRKAVRKALQLRSAKQPPPPRWNGEPRSPDGPTTQTQHMNDECERTRASESANQVDLLIFIVWLASQRRFNTIFNDEC